jgi:ribosomal protein S18 acetylase RimI-like enzyme
MQGAEQAWLQVESANKEAVTLYEEYGFSEIYRYDYRQAPQQGNDG